MENYTFYSTQTNRPVSYVGAYDNTDGEGWRVALKVAKEARKRGLRLRIRGRGPSSIRTYAAQDCPKYNNPPVFVVYVQENQDDCLVEKLPYCYDSGYWVSLNESEVDPDLLAPLKEFKL